MLKFYSETSPVGIWHHQACTKRHYLRQALYMCSELMVVTYWSGTAAPGCPVSDLHHRKQQWARENDGPSGISTGAGSQQSHQVHVIRWDVPPNHSTAHREIPYMLRVLLYICVEYLVILSYLSGSMSGMTTADGREVLTVNVNQISADLMRQASTVLSQCGGDINELPPGKNSYALFYLGGRFPHCIPHHTLTSPHLVLPGAGSSMYLLMVLKVCR